MFSLLVHLSMVISSINDIDRPSASIVLARATHSNSGTGRPLLSKLPDGIGVPPLGSTNKN